MPELEIGHVNRYFARIGVAGIEITDGDLRVGDTIHIRGHTSDFTQVVESMQIEHQTVDVSGAGDSIGIKVVEHAREHDQVLKVTEN